MRDAACPLSTRGGGGGSPAPSPSPCSSLSLLPRSTTVSHRAPLSLQGNVLNQLGEREVENYGFKTPIRVYGQYFRNTSLLACAFQALCHDDLECAFDPKESRAELVYDTKLFISTRQVMCLSPPLAGQPHWKTGRANVMVSLNGIDTTNYDSTCPYDGCVDYFYTTPRKWEFILREYLMGFIFTIVTVIYVAVRRQQYIKNNAKYVSDTGGEWEKPNLKEALMWQNEHQVRKYGHQQYKIYKTTSAELGTLGVGIGLYFEYLKIMTRYFIIMSLLAVPSIFINSRGQAYGNRDDIEFLPPPSLPY